MPQGDPKPGEKYLHFKDRLYEVSAIAYHSETMEKFVVYQALYGERETFVRPYDMFISEVDRVKYPQVTQKYRFQYVDSADAAAPESGEDSSETSWVDRILEAKSNEERYDIVCSIRDEISDSLIDDIATVLDLSIPEGDLDDRYKQLKYCMRTIQKYESDRLRQDIL